MVHISKIFFFFRKNGTKKYLFYFLAVFSLLIVSCVSLLLFLLKPSHTLAYYYDKIQNQEVFLEGVTLFDSEKKKLVTCGTEECFITFYDKYTMKNGPEKAFAHLALFQEAFPGRDCHYISHGIGHATLRLNHNDILKTLSAMDSTRYYKNIGLCGNGYYHGVVEEYAKNVHSIDGFVSLLKPLLENRKQDMILFHGVGHAAAAQFDGDIPKALLACDVLFSDDPSRFYCYSGVFMQETSYDSYSFENGNIDFLECKKHQGLRQAACYMEQSGIYESRAEDGRDFRKNIGYCKQIPDPVNRMSCIKLFPMIAVRTVKYQNIREMCHNTSSSQEEVLCTAIAADKIADSMDVHAKEYNYSRVILDVCTGIPNIFNRIRCFDIATNKKQLFYTSSQDLSFNRISLKVYKNIFNLLFNSPIELKSTARH